VKKILVIEDDPLNLTILTDFLEASGYQTVGASDGPQGVARFLEEQPDLALIDVQLPKKNGFEVCFEIKQTAHGQRAAVLIMSAVYTDERHARPYAEKGLRADGYLVKPFDLSELLARIRSLIGEA
jgi:two-component system response regulator MprA